MFKHKNDVYLEVSAKEYWLICRSLVLLRNSLIREGRYTDPIDEILEKLNRY